jgi:hypothetical protein
MRALKTGGPPLSARECGAEIQIQALTAASILALMASRLAVVNTLR